MLELVERKCRTTIVTDSAMPKRTNDFQELVSLVQKALVPAGAKVSDSHLMDVPGMSEPREIDILIESAIGPYHMKIAVEAKDHRRKMDSTQFESLVGKYFVEGGVKVNKVVIVTHRGFYQPVIDRAKKLGVELLTLSEAKAVDWSNFRPQFKPFKTALRVCDIEVSPPINQISTDTLITEGKVSCSHGTQFGTVQQFAYYLLMNNVFKNQEELLRKIDDAAALEPEGKKAKVEFKADHPHVIHVAGNDHSLEKLTFAVHFSKANIRPITLKSELHFQFAPHVCRIATKPAIQDAKNCELRSEGRLVCLCCGKDHGTLNEWTSVMVFEGLFRKNPEIVRQFQEGVRKSPQGQAWLNCEWQIDANKVIRFRGADYPVSAISAAIHAISAKAPLACKHYELATPEGDEKVLSHLEATAGGKKFSVVIPHAERGFPSKIILKVDNADSPDSNSDDKR